MIKSVFQRIFSNKVDATGLAVFRMAYVLVLFFEILQLFRFRHLIYDIVPYAVVGEVDVAYLFAIWFVILFMLFVGWFTKVAAVINYLFSIIIFSSAINFEYHVFYAYVGINFLLLFLPVSRVLSVDFLLQKLRYNAVGKPPVAGLKILEINYLVPVFMGIALVYFDSVFRKLDSPMWTDGLGIWMPSSLPMFVWNDLSFLLNQEFTVKFLGYLVIAFEAAFVFLFWFRKCRMPLFFIGFFFHLGILITYPIPYFALTALVCYLLLLPPTVWTACRKFAKSKNPTCSFYYDVHDLLGSKVAVIIKHIDLFNNIDCIAVQDYAVAHLPISDRETAHHSSHIVDASGRIFGGYAAYLALLRHLQYTYPVALLLSLPGINFIGKTINRRISRQLLVHHDPMAPYGDQRAVENAADDGFMVLTRNIEQQRTQQFWKVILVFAIAGQFILIAASPMVLRTLKNTVAETVVLDANRVFRAPLKKFFGITPHPVFMYNIHFEGYTEIFKIECSSNGKRVPLLDNNGMVTNSYANGALWVNYTFRASAPKLKQAVFEAGLSRYLRFFAHENGLQVSDYQIYFKKIEVTQKWEKDFLKRQIAKPWQRAGSATIKPAALQFNWTAAMQKIFEQEITPR